MICQLWGRQKTCCILIEKASSSVIPRFSKALFSRKAMSSLSTASLSWCFSSIVWRSKSTAKQGIPFWSRDSCTDFTWSFVASSTIFFKESFPNTSKRKSFSKKNRGVPQTLGLKVVPCFIAHHLPFHIMMVMVVLGVRNRRLEKLSCDKTILIWVKCVDNVTRFELFSQEFRHIDFVVVPSAAAICASHLIQLGNFPLLGATTPNSIPKVHFWQHCPGDFATAYVTWEKDNLKFLSQVHCCLDSVKSLLEPSAAPTRSLPVLLPELLSFCPILVSGFSENNVTFHRFCSFSSFWFLVIGAYVFYLLEVSQIFIVALTVDLCAETLLQIVIWKVVLPKPMLSVAQEYACHGVLDVSTYQGFPPCFILPWERDPANFGIGINFSEVAVASEGKDSRTLLQNEVKGVELLAKRSFLQEVVFRSKQPLFFWWRLCMLWGEKSTAMCKTKPNIFHTTSLNRDLHHPNIPNMWRGPTDLPTDLRVRLELRSTFWNHEHTLTWLLPLPAF